MQVFVGRIAMIGFAAAIVGEIQTGGKGPLGQLALPIQTPVNPGLAGGCHCKQVVPHTSKKVCRTAQVNTVHKYCMIVTTACSGFWSHLVGTRHWPASQ